jgi:hypothetical protein
VNTYRLDIAFRGPRNYLHSTDLYEEIVGTCDRFGRRIVDGPIVLKMRRRLTFQLEASLYEPGEKTDLAEAGAEFVVATANGTIYGAIRETTTPTVQRKPYDETPIWDRAILDGDTIALREPSGARPIEVLTALAVLQHRQFRPPPSGHRWMLGRLELHRPLAEGDAFGIRIKLAQQIGARMTRSTVLSADGAPLGSLHFVLAPG